VSEKALIVGWRSWFVDTRYAGPRLRSLTRGYVWPGDQPMISTCNNDHTGDPAGFTACSCGLYCANTYESLWRLGYSWSSIEHRFPIVVGELTLWGTVMESEWGFRATHAYPRKLYVPEYHWKVAMPLRERYGVRVKLVYPPEMEGEVQESWT
jgi:hypothetical protein